MLQFRGEIWLPPTTTCSAATPHAARLRRDSEASAVRTSLQMCSWPVEDDGLKGGECEARGAGLASMDAWRRHKRDFRLPPLLSIDYTLYDAKLLLSTLYLVLLGALWH